MEEAAAAEPSLTELLPEVLISAIGEQLAADEDVLRPRNLGSLARTCKVIKEAVRDAKDKLKVKYDAASALVVKSGDAVERIVEERPTWLVWYDRGLTAADAPALTNVLKSKALAQLDGLHLHGNNLGDEGAAAAAAMADSGRHRLTSSHSVAAAVLAAAVTAAAAAATATRARSLCPLRFRGGGAAGRAAAGRRRGRNSGG